MIDKDIETLKERAKEMLDNNYSRKIGDEELYTIICEWENVLKELETYKKIAEFLACEYWNIDGNFDGSFNDWQDILEWARKEVENEP